MRAYVLIRLAAVLSLVVLVLTFCTNTHAQRKNQATAEIFGVVKGAEGAPVVLHLRALDDNPIRYYDGYEQTAGTDGSFHFAEIQPGTYQLETDPSGFRIPAPEGIALHAGESRKGIVVSVTRSFSLCGRVTENGTAKDDTWVNVYRYNPEFATLSQEFIPHLGSGGSFSIANLTPGTYYLAGYTTYYPGSFNFNGAKPILVGADNPKTCNLEIPLQYTGCHVTKVSGRIASLSGDGPADGSAKYKVLFLSTNKAGGRMAAIIASNSNDVYKSEDSFSATVCQGNYDVVLSDEYQIGSWGDSPTHKVVFDSRNIEVGATAIDGVELTPHAMASISGEMPGMTHNVSCPAGGPRVRVSILRDGDGQFQSVQLDDKNRFNFHHVAPGEYTISVGPFAREAFYLNSILVDGKPIDGRKFTVAQTQPMTMVINVSGDLKNAAGHLSPEVRREPRWEVGWTRPKGSVAGRVLTVNQAGTTLELQSARYNSNASVEYTVHAGEDGSFRFNTVDPGVYTLRAVGKGILTTAYGSMEAGERGTPIVVRRGAQIQGLTLSPARLSAVCGRLTGPEGGPQAGARISLQWSHGGNIYGEQTGESQALTDAEGRFRIAGVSPGEYFLSSPLDGNRIVFFSPDGAAGTATPLVVHAGADVGCGKSAALNLAVPQNYKKTYAFSGNVNGDLPAAIGDRFWAGLLTVRPSGEQQFLAVAKLDAERRFSFDNVPGGHFVLQLHSAYGPEPEMWSGPYGPVEHLLTSQKIDIPDGMANVSITPMPLPTVTGTVHFTDVPKEWKNHFDVGQQKITLVPREYRAPFSAMLAADGSFSIGPEDVGDYEVHLDLRAPLYIQSVKLDGREIKGRYFHLATAASAKLEVQVSGDSGQVNARVLPDPSLPMAEPSVSETCSKSAYPEPAVVLFPDPMFAQEIANAEPELDFTAQLRLFRSTAFADRNNPTLQILAVPPGHYRALAIQGPGIMGSPFGRPNAHSKVMQKLWNELAALGEPVTVQSGVPLELTLRDKTIDANRAAAKMGVPLERGLLDWWR
jgi:hypothetical protein